MIGVYSFGQNKNEDSTQICFPYQVGQKILLDLNEGDKNKKLLESSYTEIDLLNSKVEQKDSIIGALSKQAEIDKQILESTNEKFITVEGEYKTLKKENKILKIKNTIFNILSTAIIGGLTYVLITK